LVRCSSEWTWLLLNNVTLSNGLSKIMQVACLEGSGRRVCVVWCTSVQHHLMLMLGRQEQETVASVLSMVRW